jgi:uncharacterized membrane protein
MPSLQTLKRLQNWIWILIYAGLLSCVVSLFLPTQERVMAATLQVSGGLLVLLGALLVYVRSRLQETPPNTPPKSHEGKNNG